MLIKSKSDDKITHNHIDQLNPTNPVTPVIHLHINGDIYLLFYCYYDNMPYSAFILFVFPLLVLPVNGLISKCVIFVYEITIKSKKRWLLIEMSYYLEHPSIQSLERL